MKPKGLEHHGRTVATLNIDHFIIKAHQEAYPELEAQMKRDHDNAVNIYAAFISMLVLKVKGRLTPVIKTEIMRRYKLL